MTFDATTPRSRPGSAPRARPARRPGERRVRWAVAGLVLLSVVPVAAGAVRVTGLAQGAAATPGSARFVASPVPVVVHIITASVFCVLGAFQFLPSLRRRGRRWHRRAGRLVAVAGVAAAGSGLWMTVTYPDPPGDDGRLLRVIRLVVVTAMAVALVRGALAARRRDLAGHRAWMLRGYAIGQGAGTQVLTGLPWLVATGSNAVGVPKALLLTAGWVINVVVAERIIRARRGPRRAPL